MIPANDSEASASEVFWCGRKMMDLAAILGLCFLCYGLCELYQWHVSSAMKELKDCKEEDSRNGLFTITSFDGTDFVSIGKEQR